ncbi:MAG: folylpolyglutamate synthase/dihydrofolate synthase family protein [Bacteroidales bacterium]|nr:folylpolyglutamate synthase/dihydrofolate synthase family protein [Bacteroidales bacterium]
MNYSDTLDFLFSSLPMYQRIGKAAYKSDLTATLSLDRHLGEPHRSFQTIHIAGTNGKGSVSHMLAAIMQGAGYKTGLYTSPHYTDFRERIRINGEMIDEQYVVDFVEANKDVLLELKASFFEMTVAIAFTYFKYERVDIAIVETGMGGRLDSTNIITPLISVITNIGYDHTQYLGDTLEKIAIEKAGIIKKEVPVVIGSAKDEVREVFAAKAREMDSAIYFADENFTARHLDTAGDASVQTFNLYRDGILFMKELLTDLPGDFQLLNIPAVLQTLELLGKHFKVNPGVIRSGLRDVKGLTGFKGRWQVMRQAPLVICDSGHNADGMKISVSQLKGIDKERLHIVLGMVNDKDADSILSLLPRNADYYFTKADIPRALDQELLRGKALEYSLKGNSYPFVIEAFNAALACADKEDLIFIGGSSFVVADFLRDYNNV